MLTVQIEVLSMATASEHKHIAVNNENEHKNVKQTRNEGKSETNLLYRHDLSTDSSATRGVQKVRRPTQLTARYAHHILSLFDIFSCN